MDSGTLEIPDELKDLYTNTGRKLVNVQNKEGKKLNNFLRDNPMKVSDAHGLENWAKEKTRNLDGLGPQGDRAKDMIIGAEKQAQDLYNNRSQYTTDAREGYSRVWDKANELYDTENNADLQASRSATERLGDISRKKVDASAEAIANDAALKASQEAFNLTVAPQIANQMSSMGMGRSSRAADMSADAWAKNATPHIQEAIARQERDIGREYQGAADQATNYLNIGSKGMEGKVAALGSMGQTSAGVADLGAQDDSRRAGAVGLRYQGAGQMKDYAESDWNAHKGAIDEAMAVGGVHRGITDARNKAKYDDFLRQQGIAENALMGPLGGMPSMIGPKGK